MTEWRGANVVKNHQFLQMLQLLRFLPHLTPLPILRNFVETWLLQITPSHRIRPSHAELRDIFMDFKSLLNPPPTPKNWTFSCRTFVWTSDLSTSNHCSPHKNSTFSWRTWIFCVDFRFGYMKSPQPLSGSDLLMQILNILCALQIIPTPQIRPT